MRIGLVCPYSWDVPGGVQAHVRDLAEHLISEGHEVSVLAPADDDAALPPYVVAAGRAVPVPYNGSVARLAFGPVSVRRVRRWLREGEFDVLHVHEPSSPSLSLIACWTAVGPMVGTFHQSMERSRVMAAGAAILQTALEKLSARIAVSAAARQTLVDHLGGEAILIPNGVHVAGFTEAAAAPRVPGRSGEGRALGFLGRLDEPRKGLPVLLDAFPQILDQVPDVRLMLAGPGDADDVLDALPASARSRVEVLGRVTEAEKVRMLRDVDVYVAPNTGGESFGIVLLEAMAADTAILASDLDAFVRVLDDAEAGEVFPVGDSEALAKQAVVLLDDEHRRDALRAHGREVVQRYDWVTVGRDIIAVYETVAAAGLKVREDGRGQAFGRLPRLGLGG
jgi:phosphatidylinositol alpha-mannosyltransferase